MSTANKMFKPVPKVAAIHDIVGVGRCSLTSIIPILSSFEVQVCPLPTAIFSSHPSGFSGIHIRDLSDDINPYFKHWQKMNVEFDCFYTGYLNSENQINSVIDIIKSQKDCVLKVIDPVMGDNGQPYSIFDKKAVFKMKNLISYADIITPNFTEVCLLLEIDYYNEEIEYKRILEHAKELCKLGSKKVIITGINSSEYGDINFCYDSLNDEYFYVPFKKVPAVYPGTGDAFASTVVGGLLNNMDLKQAIILATEYIYETILYTFNAKTPIREGILIEKTLKMLKGEEYEKK